MKIFRVGIFLFSALLYFFVADISYAADLLLYPQNTTVSVNDEVEVTFTINTRGEYVTSSDVILSFDESMLNVVNVGTTIVGLPPFFPRNFHYITPNQVYFGGSVLDLLDSRTGQGVIGTIRFKALRPGIAAIRFVCNPGRTDDTNITKNDSNATDIVECNLLNSGSFTITSTPQPKLGDVNGDGFVTLSDLSTLLSNFRKINMIRNQGDVNGDNQVNLHDLSSLLSNFGK